MKERFNYWTTTKGLLLTLLFEYILVYLSGFLADASLQEDTVLLMAFIGVVTIIILSIEVVEKIKNVTKLFIFLMATIIQFITFFAVQYGFMLFVVPNSFGGVSLSPVSLFFQSTMVFVFNPLIIPNGNMAELLILLNIFGAVVVVFFVIQNIWQLQATSILVNKDLEKEKTHKVFPKHNKEDLYIRVLLWAHDKQESGFSWEEMKKHFCLNDSQESWVRKIFLTASDTDRKFFEILKNDESSVPNVYYYALNEKGLTAAVDYLKQRESARETRLALVVGIFAVGVAIWTGVLSKNAVQLAIQPQVDFYLQPVGTSTEEYIFGIENNGTVPIIDISAEYTQESIFKKGCLTDSTEVTCGGSSVSEDVFFGRNTSIPVLHPSESKEAKIFISNSGQGNPREFIQALAITVTYAREVDKQKRIIPVIYFIDSWKVYTLDAVKDIPSMKLYLATFRELSAETTLGNQKIYWK